MAEKKADKKKQDRKKGGGKLKILLLAALGAGLVFPGFGLVVAAGLTPALVIGLTDRSAGKCLAVCVGSLNAAGVLQVVLMMAQGGVTLENALRVLQRPEMFLVMWGAAAIGLGLYSFVPQLVAHGMAAMAEMRIKKLKANQKEIRRLWGEEVSQ